MQRDVPLAPMTTLGIGGPAKYFVRAATVDEIRDAVAWASANHEPVFFLAGGSNVLIADSGFAGLVIKIELRGIVVESKDATAVHVKVAAGESWDDVVAFAVERGWAGVECLSGIPGTAGATPIQNVGAYGQDVSETIVRVELLERANGRVITLTNSECRFGYRSSLFKNIERERYVVLSVTYRLTPGGEGAVRYPELQKYLDGVTDVRAVRAAVIAIRKRKGMVIDPADPDTRSDGSFFMNPVIPASRLPDPNMPYYPSGDEVKLSAAWLIEQAGFQKGFVHGRAGLSTKHTLAVMNRGGATAREILELVEMIQARVKERFGVELQPEPNFVGFAPSS